MSPRTERLLERARALVAEPNNMDVRTRFLAATFNIDPVLGSKHTLPDTFAAASDVLHHRICR